MFSFFHTFPDLKITQIKFHTFANRNYSNKTKHRY